MGGIVEHKNYTRFHEKLICAVVKLIVTKKIEILVFIPLLLLFAAAVLTYVFLADTSFDSVYITLLIIVAAYAAALLSCKLLFASKHWETIDAIDNSFYEEEEDVDDHDDGPPPGSDTRETSTTKAKYKIRPIEELYYSKGIWRTVASNHIVRFRGVNLPAKTPVGGDSIENLYKSRADVTFVGKPFPLKEAPEHFQRMSNYGYNILRLTITWEAVMHRAPGVVDYEYLEYISELVDIAAAYGLYIIIDPHQDVWSRFTGGDGAPWWTLDVAGFQTNDSSLQKSGCAFLSNVKEENSDGTNTSEESRDKMIWPTNYGKLATATMFTLFFAGDTYAPGIYADADHFQATTKTSGMAGEEMTIQSFLQKYYFEFIDIVAQTMKDKKNVLGFNTMNEANKGYVGVRDLNSRTFPCPLGISHSYFDSMRLGSGDSLSLEYYSSPFHFSKKMTLNSSNCIAWKSPDHDIWRKMGVFQILASGEKKLMQPNYFKSEGDFTSMFMLPFYEKIGEIVRKRNKKFVVYAEPFINLTEHEAITAPSSFDEDKYGWAPHWYDFTTLSLQRYIPWFAINEVSELPVISKSRVAAMMRRNILALKQCGGNGKFHFVLGEFGVPFDMNIEGDNAMYAASTMALDRSMQAIEANDVDYTLWNYSADNTNDHGDNWNNEDLSIRTKTENRALLTAVRPYAQKIPEQFEIVSQKFDPTKLSKNYELRVCRQQKDDSDTNRITSRTIFIYLPQIHYMNPKITTSNASNSTTIYDPYSQTLRWENVGEEGSDDELSLSVCNQ